MTIPLTTPYLDRIAVLAEIMLRTDLSAAELRICGYLLITVMNQTGNCTCADNHLAQALGIDRSTVNRAKRNLRKKHIITWPNLGKLPAQTHAATAYSFFLLKKGAHPRRQLCRTDAGSLPASTQADLPAPTQPEQHSNKPAQKTATSLAPERRYASSPDTRPKRPHTAYSKPQHGDRDKHGRFYATLMSAEQEYAEAFARKRGLTPPHHDRHGGSWLDSQWPQEH